MSSHRSKAFARASAPARASRRSLLPFLALGFFAACGGDQETAQRGGPGGSRGPGMDGDAVVPVEIMPVELGTIARRVTVSGVIEPIRRVGVNSQLGTALVSVRVEEGDLVEEGQVLATLDDRELAAQVASAEANFRIAESTYRRTEQLRDRQIVTQAEYDRDFAAYLTTEAQLEQLQTRLGYATVRAPLSGVITQKLVEAGDVVGNQTRLFTIADVSTMVVRVQVSELDVVDLAAGDEVAVAFDAFPGRLFDGRVRRVFPSADPESRLVPVEVELRGEGAALARPGFLARVTFALSERNNALLVPSSALVTGGGGSAAVFVVDENQARRRAVTTGLTSEGRIEVLSGLTEGELVVTSGTNMVRDGGEVRLVSRDGRADPASAADIADSGAAPLDAGGGSHDDPPDLEDLEGRPRGETGAPARVAPNGTEEYER